MRAKIDANLDPRQRAVRDVGFVAAAPFVLLRAILTSPIEGARALVRSMTAHLSQGPLRSGIDAFVFGATGLFVGAARIPETAVGVAASFADAAVRFVRRPNLREGIELLLTVPVGLLYAAASPLVEAARAADEGWFAPRPLSLAERALLACSHEEDVLDAVRVHPSESWVRRLNAAVLPSGGSMTFGDHVYEAKGGMASWTLRHELFHVEQGRATPGGVMAFLSRYLVDTVAGRLARRASGVGPGESRYEDEAQDI